MRRQTDDTVPAKLYGSRLVYIDMSGLGGDDCLIVVENAVDDRGIGLCAAGQKPDLGVRSLASLTDALLGPFGPFVEAIGEALFIVGF